MASGLDASRPAAITDFDGILPIGQSNRQIAIGALERSDGAAALARAEDVVVGDDMDKVSKDELRSRSVNFSFLPARARIFP